jgi:hypothetical protein
MPHALSHAQHQQRTLPSDNQPKFTQEHKATNLDQQRHAEAAGALVLAHKRPQPRLRAKHMHKTTGAAATCLYSRKAQMHTNNGAERQPVHP